MEFYLCGMTDSDTSKKDTPKKKRAAKKTAEPAAEPGQKHIPASKTITKDEPKEEQSDDAGNNEPVLHKPVPPQFIADLKAFADVLTANPALIEPVREVFEYHLVDPLDRKTFPKIVNAMSMLLGSSATMVVMTATHVNNPAFFEDILATAGKDEKVLGAVWTLQHLTAIYGNRVQQAYSLSSGTMDEDWHTIDVNTFRREGEQSFWQIALNMTLYNGTTCDIKMTPDSAFQLISILAEELAHNVPREFVDEALVEKCRKENTDFHEKFYADSAGEKKEDSPAGYA